MASLELASVSKSYGEVEVLRNIDLSIDQGELVVFVGPSGCGKSTLLHMIAGLETITGGELQIDGQRMNETPPAQRGTMHVPIASADADMCQKVEVGARPEDLTETSGDDFVFEGKVEVIEKLGETTNLYFAAAGSRDPLIAKLPGTRATRKEDTVRLTAESGKLHMFEQSGKSFVYR